MHYQKPLVTKNRRSTGNNARNGGGHSWLRPIINRLWPTTCTWLLHENIIIKEMLWIFQTEDSRKIISSWIKVNYITTSIQGSMHCEINMFIWLKTIIVFNLMNNVWMHTIPIMMHSRENLSLEKIMIYISFLVTQQEVVPHFQAENNFRILWKWT